jgi:quercetin dioxygenase-like cupin family protein
MCKIREELRNVKTSIIAKAAVCDAIMSSGIMQIDRISPMRWSEISPGVSTILCSLDAMSDNRTVVNCVFNPGAKMDEHEHDRVETVHVIGGSIMETISGETLHEGASKHISPFERHGWHSETGAMLTISWKPAYTKTEL